MEKHGIPGVSYCPYTKIIIPSYKDVKVNKLKLKFDTDLKYKFTGVLNDGNYYTDEGDTILNEIKLFKNTHYVITFDTTIDTNKKQIKFASSIPSSGDYNEYQGFTYTRLNDKVLFDVNELIGKLYLYNGETPSDTDIGSHYDEKIVGEQYYELIKSFRITGLGRNVKQYENQVDNYRKVFTPHYLKISIENNYFSLFGDHDNIYTYYKESGDYERLIFS